MTDINDIFSCFWEIYMNIPNEKTLNQIINIINKISRWAFVYTEHPNHNYRFYGYIVFRLPQDPNFLKICLGENGAYMNTNEHPNKYRRRGLQLANDFADELDIIIRINKGSYNGVAPP
jgi:hypothetical protein